MEYLLVQFVDLHGSAKVKMVPREQLDAVADSGAGFAGGAVWGMGQNAALSRHDGAHRPGHVHAGSLVPGLARFAADLYVDDVTLRPLSARVI